MSESLQISKGNKKEQYQNLLPQIEALISANDDWIGKMANMTAALKQQFNWFWVGFYRVVGEELIVGPFQGPIACVRISKGKGVCGQCWATEKSIIVPNVNEFPGHIACNNQAQSEIVIPVFEKNKIIAVLDIDSEQIDTFNDVDKKALTKMAALLTP